MRAGEGPARAARPPFAPNTLAPNGRRCVDDWLPLRGAPPGGPPPGGPGR